MVYLDNAATTMMPPAARAAMAAWTNRGNPSAAYASAREARALIDRFRAALAAYCGVQLPPVSAAGAGAPGAYELLFTSGGSESNCTIVRAVVDAYVRATGRLPHVVSSTVEHHSLLACLHDLEAARAIQLTLVPPQPAGPECGSVAPAAVGAAVRPNTALVTVMAANNETGAINDVRAIATAVRAAARRFRVAGAPVRLVPVHTDAVQLFGKGAFAPRELGVDAFSVSFHKLGGPAGVGLLGIRRELVDGYRLCPLVCGTQNGGLRGGTEAVHQLAAAYAGFQHHLTDRVAKNRRLGGLRDTVRRELARRGLACSVYTGGVPAARPAAVWLAPPDDRRVLPGTLLLAVLPAAGKPFCNEKARAALEARGFIVSVGSACNSGASRPSHVLTALGVPPELARGTLRVSFGDDVTEAEAAAFAAALAQLARAGV